MDILTQQQIDDLINTLINKNRLCECGCENPRQAKFCMECGKSVLSTKESILTALQEWVDVLVNDSGERNANLLKTINKTIVYIQNN